MAKHLLIEKYIPAVRDQGGINTNLPVTLNTSSSTLTVGGTLTVTGNTTLSGTATVKFPVIDVTASTLTLTAAQTGSVVLLDRAAGTTITLPAPSVGLWYRFVVPTSVTSNSYKIITDAGTTFVLGQLDVTVSTGTAKLFFGDGATHVSINGNGTTTGGLAGSQFDLTCITSTLWNVEGTWNGSGTVATPFATS